MDNLTDSTLLAEETAESETFSAETGLFTPVSIDDDPLSNAESLPTLFPQEDEPIVKTPIEPTPEVTEEPKKRKCNWKRISIIIAKWVIAVILAVAVLPCGLIGYLTVTEYNPAYAEKAQSGNVQISATYQSTMPLRIVTFNTGYGALGEDADFFMDGGESVTPESEEYIKSNMLGIEKILKKVDADIILLQEVDTDSKRSYGLNQWLQYEYDIDNY